MNKIRLLLSGSSNMQNYIEAVEFCGAVPTAEYLPKVDTSYDGLVLCGGSDVAPDRYNEPIDGSVNIDYERDAAEFALLKAYLDAGKPILGICRGLQLINIFFGGSLYQDIVESDLHKKHDGVDNRHKVDAVPRCVLNRIYGDAFFVNSAHHQAIKLLGSGIRATAFWEGKYVEAIEHDSYPILAVQWHPERMCFKNKREDTVCGAAVFEHFIDLCRRYRDGDILK